MPIANENNYNKIICAVCGDDDNEFVLSSSDNMSEDSKEYPLVKCNSCGLVFMGQNMTQEELDKSYYTGYPGNSVKTLKVIAKNKGLIPKILGFLYFSQRNHILNTIRQLKPITAGTSLLDIGCGNGGFLYFMQKMTGVTGEGIEMGSIPAQFASEELGFNIYKGTTENISILKKYDIITMFQYLEHDMSPNATLQKVRSLLNDKGMLLIEIPNISSITFKIFGKYWFGLDLPRHVYSYSPKTLSLLLQKNGFEVEKLVNYPHVNFVSSFFNYLGIGKSIRNIWNYPWYISIPFAYLPEMVINTFLGYLLRPFFPMDTFAIYATPKTSSD